MEAGTLAGMTDVTQLLDAIDAGDPKAAGELLPLVYDELRKLAAGHMANEAAGHTLDATALVHEAYLRLIGPNGDHAFANRRHFFAAAAQAMRRILVESARRRRTLKRGGRAALAAVDLENLPASQQNDDTWIDLDEALTRFETLDADAAELAKLRLFAGLSIEEAAEALDIPRASAFRLWTYARAWLTAALKDRPQDC